jgi:hypothetical protein
MKNVISVVFINRLHAVNYSLYNILLLTFYYNESYCFDFVSFYFITGRRRRRRRRLLNFHAREIYTHLLTVVE